MICEAEIVVVNFHVALISTAVALRVGMQIQIHLFITGKRASAKVVYVDPDQPRFCGIGWDQPKNIWGVALHRKTGPKLIWTELLNNNGSNQGLLRTLSPLPLDSFPHVTGN